MTPINVKVHEEDERGNVYTLTVPILYCGLEIPAGFESDGASVPRFFWRCVFPPGEPRALLAAFVHDFIYRTHPKGWTKKEADNEFYHLLCVQGIPRASAWLAYQGVKLFGGPAWRAGGKETK
jgi:hypothetical protein